MKDGYYDCRATGETERGYSSKNTKQIAVTFEVLADVDPKDPNAERVVLGKVFSKLSFSPDATSWTVDKLKSLGFTMGPKGLELQPGIIGRCCARSRSYVTGKGDTETTQDWDIVTGGRRAFKDDAQMSDRDSARLDEELRALFGGKPSAPASRSNGSGGRGRNDDPPPMQGDDDFGGL